MTVVLGVPPGRGLLPRLLPYVDGVRGMLLGAGPADTWGVGEREPGKVVWCVSPAGVSGASRTDVPAQPLTGQCVSSAALAMVAFPPCPPTGDCPGARSDESCSVLGPFPPDRSSFIEYIGRGSSRCDHEKL